MAHYINKNALLAEIERRIAEYKEMKIDSSYYEGMITSLEFFRDEFINTLEVKEVDLEGISRHYALNNSPWDDCRDEIQDAYKAGFELGFKTQKVEEI